MNFDFEETKGTRVVMRFDDKSDNIEFFYEIGDDELIIHLPFVNKNKLHGKFRLFFNRGNVHVSTHSLLFSDIFVNNMSLRIGKRQWTSLAKFNVIGENIANWKDFGFTNKQTQTTLDTLSKIVVWYYKTWSYTHKYWDGLDD